MIGNGQDEVLKYFSEKKDIEKRKELFKLMQNWEKIIETIKEPITFPDDGIDYPAIKYFSFDGFFPGYFSNNPKVLFIGREPRWASENDRIKMDIDMFKNNDADSYPYWHRILYLAYGIKNCGKKEFEEIPYVNEIATEMFEKRNFNFAIMNVSKYSNDSKKGGTADYKMINRFLKDSRLNNKHNFIRKEIELLEPDIIITANLWDGKIDAKEIERIFPEKDFESIKDTDKVNFYNFNLNTKKIKILNLYHFAAFARGINGKSLDEVTKDYFYDPVMKLLFG